MPKGNSWFYKNLDDCIEGLGRAAYPPDGSQPHCNGTWDSVLCWPATMAGTTAKLPCPPLRALDHTKFGYKKCGPDGRWEGRYPGDYSLAQGWTNYSECYTPEAKKIYDKLFGKTNPQVMKEIANGTRIMEMVGLSLSLLSVAFSIFVFSYFRSLRCHRTRIHRNLFVAILIHLAIQLTVHADQFVARMSGGDVGGTAVSSLGTISNTPLLCEVLLTSVEYSKTVMFMWMFIEGVYLHNMVVVSVFSGKPNYILYYVIGWGVPVIITTTWAVTNGLTADTQSQCWFGYTYRPYYWILEGPRVAIIGVNLIFLLNIIRVLVTKLRKTSSTEALQVRKAVKAAIVLLPLLGFNNFLALVEAPLDTPVKFAVWSYTAHFLISFQGFFISLLYCFLNGEVQSTLSQYWVRHQLSRDGFSSSRRTQSRTLSMTISEIHLHQRRETETTSFMNNHKKTSLYDAGVTASLHQPEADG